MSAVTAADGPEIDATGHVVPDSATPGPVIEVDYTNPGLSPSHWVLTLSPDGAGHFWSENPKMEQAGAQGQPPPAPAVDRDIHVSGEFARRTFEEAGQHKFFAEECESHLKVAFQGLKKLSYRGPDGEGSCAFNYSKDKQMEGLGESLVSVAETIVEGSRLDWLLRYDPLGLDQEMQYVVDGAGDGRLQEFGTIRGILEKLAQDDGVLDRVRKRARTLLARAQGYGAGSRVGAWRGAWGGGWGWENPRSKMTFEGTNGSNVCAGERREPSGPVLDGGGRQKCHLTR